LKFYLIFIILICSIALNAISVNDLFPELEYGRYEVGYKVFEVYDKGRTFGFPDKNDPEKNLDRPMQISLWYPAVEESSDPMKYIDYEYSAVTEVDFEADNKKSKTDYRNEKIKLFKEYKADLDLLNDIFDLEMKAGQDAPFLEKEFPLIIYNPGGNEKAYENCVLFEYLASQGFVIAATPSFGTDSRETIFDKALLKTLLADMRFAVYHVSKLGITNEKLAAMGFCLGGFVCDLFAQENSQIDALVELYGEIGTKDSRDKFAMGKYEKFKNPKAAFLQLDVADILERDSFLYDNLKYSDSYQIRYRDVAFTSFTSFYLLQAYSFKQQIADYDQRLNVYKSICKNTGSFLKYYLKDDISGLQYLNNEIENSSENDLYTVADSKIGKEAPPNYIVFKKLLQTDFDKAYETYTKTKIEDPDVYLFDEISMNFLGYKYLQSGNIELALKILELNAREYPESWNVYDSLGDAYFTNKELGKAKSNYEKSLELNPQNDHAGKRLEEIE